MNNILKYKYKYKYYYIICIRASHGAPISVLRILQGHFNLENMEVNNTYETMSKTIGSVERFLSFDEALTENYF